jgi:beta-lactamase class A
MSMERPAGGFAYGILAAMFPSTRTRGALALAAIVFSAYLLPARPALSDTTTRGDLSPRQDIALQRELNQLVDARGWGPMVDNGSMAVALVIIRKNSYRLAMLNGRHMLYAASLPKIAVLFAAMVAAQEGDLVIDEELEEDMHDMIRVSCNPCATRVMARVGREKLLKILQRPEYEFYDDDGHGGLWVGKDYAGRAAYRRDPLHGLSHGATAFQVARIYYHLYRGTLLDKKHTAMMREIMANPGISHKFVKGLSKYGDLELWRKSGSWRDFHADSVLVQSPAATYILVGLVEGPNGDRQLETMAREAHQLVIRLEGNAS